MLVQNQVGKVHEFLLKTSSFMNDFYLMNQILTEAYGQENIENNIKKRCGLSVYEQANQNLLIVNFYMLPKGLQ